MSNQPITPEQARAALDQAGNAELDIIADTRPNPAWLWPAIGLTAGLFFASFDIVGESAWVALTSILYAVAIGMIIRVVQKQRGTQAKLSRLPAELRRQVLVFAIAGGLVSGLAVPAALLLLDGPPRFTIIGIIIAGLTVVGGRFADSRYIAAAERIRAERAGQPQPSA